MNNKNNKLMFTVPKPMGELVNVTFFCIHIGFDACHAPMTDRAFSSIEELVKTSEFEDQGKFNLSSEKHVTIFYSFWRAVLDEKKYHI